LKIQKGPSAYIVDQQSLYFILQKAVHYFVSSEFSKQALQDVGGRPI
jgi:hypothetical protein